MEFNIGHAASDALAFLVQLLLLLNCVSQPTSATAFLWSACPLQDPTTYHWKGFHEHLKEAYKTWKACPDIKDLNLYIHAGGCVLSFEPWAFEFPAGDTFPPLRNLTLTDYDFEDSALRRFLDPGLLRLQSYAMNAWDRIRLAAGGPLGPEHDSSLEKWLRAMDWAQLERLDINAHEQPNLDYFWTRMKNELPNLRHLSTHLTTISDPLFAFLGAIPPLETLSIHQMHVMKSTNSTPSCEKLNLERILPRHGPTLRNLRLSQYESPTLHERRIACNAAEIAQLYKWCPHLTHLTLDLDRNGAWPKAELAALVSLPSLTSLHLRLELGENLHTGAPAAAAAAGTTMDVSMGMSMGIISTGSNSSVPGSPFREPAVNVSVAEHLFDTLRRLKSGAELARLELEVGDDNLLPYYGPDGFEQSPAQVWTRRYRRRYICEADRLRKDKGKVREGGSGGSNARALACWMVTSRDWDYC